MIEVRLLDTGELFYFIVVVESEDMTEQVLEDGASFEDRLLVLRGFRGVVNLVSVGEGLTEESDQFVHNIGVLDEQILDNGLVGEHHLQFPTELLHQKSRRGKQTHWVLHHVLEDHGWALHKHQLLQEVML